MAEWDSERRSGSVRDQCIFPSSTFTTVMKVASISLIPSFIAVVVSGLTMRMGSEATIVELEKRAVSSPRRTPKLYRAHLAGFNPQD